MMDLNGSLTRVGAEPGGARLRWATGLCVTMLGLGACHDDSPTAPKTASAITVASGAAQTGTVGSALAAAVVLQVNDQNGTGMAGVSVTVTAGAGSGSVSAVQLTTDAKGQASVSWTLGTVAGVDTLVAQVGSIPAVNVLATATPDVPASIVVVGGDDQSAPAGTALSSPLTVKVVDKYGNAVPNVAVTFSDDANGTFGAPTVTTDASGIATDTITLGGAIGTDDITVTVQTATGAVTVTLHETAM